jgi:2-polyprenyl-3-methyl-5-hydroxy-6-metoxy-1,4-benzoquinol methylase
VRHVCCDLCGADEPRVISQTGRLGLPVRTVICRRCGLVYTDPIRELDDYEGEDREKVRRLQKPASRPSEKYLAKNRLRAEAAMQLLAPRVRKDMRALDVGCAAGTLLSMLRTQGCRVVGVEPEPAFADYARKERHIEVHQCLLEETELEPESFDLVCASHVLEHTDSPTAFLDGVWQLLKPGGLLFIEVPNLLEPRCSLRRLFHVAHRYNFTPATLEAMARKAGFETLTLRELPRPGAVQILAAKTDKPGDTFDPSGAEKPTKVLRRLRWHRVGYYATLLFLRRKLWKTY